MITLFKIFEGKYVNKFDFEVGKSYEYYELPNKVRDDVDIQFADDDYDGYAPDDYVYIFTLLSPDDLIEYLENHFGKYDIQDEMDDPYVKKLVKNIKKNGLDYPSVGLEGNHRALAFYMMNKPLPYLEMKLKSEEELELKYNGE